MGHQKKGTVGLTVYRIPLRTCNIQKMVLIQRFWKSRTVNGIFIIEYFEFPAVSFALFIAIAEYCAKWIVNFGLKMAPQAGVKAVGCFCRPRQLIHKPGKNSSRCVSSFPAVHEIFVREDFHGSGN